MDSKEKEEIFLKVDQMYELADLILKSFFTPNVENNILVHENYRAIDPYIEKLNVLFDHIVHYLSKVGVPNDSNQPESDKVLFQLTSVINRIIDTVKMMYKSISYHLSYSSSFLKTMDYYPDDVESSNLILKKQVSYADELLVIIFEVKKIIFERFNIVQNAEELEEVFDE